MLDDYLVASTARRLIAVRGLGAGQIAPTDAYHVPAGLCHAYLPDDDLTLCGLEVKLLLTFPDGARFITETVDTQCETCYRAWMASQ